MLITLFSDISFCHQTGVGAYAWWAKVNGQTFRGGGVFRELIRDSNVAEVYGLINAIYASINEIKPIPGSKYIAESDSGVAISILQGKSGGTRLENTVLRQMMDQKLAKHALQVEYRHVSAHKGDATPRNAVNSWCDRTARALMRQRRRTLAEAGGLLSAQVCDEGP
jgi:ribonuclease HI